MYHKFFTILGFAALLLMPAGAMAVDLPSKMNTENYVSPETVEGVTTVDAEQAHELWKERVVFIDTRKDSDWEAGRIPGAFHIPYKPGKPDQPFTEQSLMEVAAEDQPIVCYCNGSSCDRSSWCAALAKEWGWEEVYYFRDGYPAWKNTGYPVE